jgi:hypothetical protein
LLYITRRLRPLRCCNNTVLHALCTTLHYITPQTVQFCASLPFTVVTSIVFQAIFHFATGLNSSFESYVYVVCLTVALLLMMEVRTSMHFKLTMLRLQTLLSVQPLLQVYIVHCYTVYTCHTACVYSNCLQHALAELASCTAIAAACSASNNMHYMCTLLLF